MYPVNDNEIRLVQDMFQSLGLLEIKGQGIQEEGFLLSSLVEKIKAMSVNQPIDYIDKIFNDKYIKDVSENAEKLNIDVQGTKISNIIRCEPWRAESDGE